LRQREIFEINQVLEVDVREAVLINWLRNMFRKINKTKEDEGSEEEGHDYL